MEMHVSNTYITASEVLCWLRRTTNPTVKLGLFNSPFTPNYRPKKSAYYSSIQINSTRRFSDLPASVALSAIG